jgi:1-pyrroline-5-carboxylate dehydrogenase
MLDARMSPPPPVNEPILSYAPGTPERAALKTSLAKMAAETVDVPMFIDGEEVRTGKLIEARSPHDKSLVLARAHEGDASHVERAIAAALKAQPEWSRMPWTARAAIFLKAADLLTTRLRPVINGATMLGQSKTAHQAEIDSACELIDFLRFNVAFASRLYEEQPVSGPGMWNQSDYRPLEGFVYAVTPFNFTAIAGNLTTSVAMMGNTVVWKPANNALLSGHYVMELLREAGLPPGVVNLVLGDPVAVSDQVFASPHLAGVHFTGSTPVFQSMWKKVGENIGRYRSYPRLVGETGGKDFVFAHASADVEALAVALARGAFEFQGQKCSAASRAYIPRSIWPAVRDRLVDHVASIKVGDVRDFRNFMGAVIDGRAFARITDYIALAKSDASCSILTGGTASSEVGWFVQPTVVETTNPRHRLMSEEIFGPLLTIFVYPDGDEDAAMALLDSTSPYALTGAVFANDRRFLERASDKLRFAAGNFYLNDKPTGAVVGQQPFGGGRGSGTNDKAGSALNLMRWVSPRTIKETFVPPRALGYPFLEAE